MRFVPRSVKRSRRFDHGGTLGVDRRLMERCPAVIITSFDVRPRSQQRVDLEEHLRVPRVAIRHAPQDGGRQSGPRIRGKRRRRWGTDHAGKLGCRRTDFNDRRNSAAGPERNGAGLHKRGQRSDGVNSRQQRRQRHRGHQRYAEEIDLPAIEITRRREPPRVLPAADRGPGPRPEQAVDHAGVEYLPLEQWPRHTVEAHRRLDGRGILPGGGPPNDRRGSRRRRRSGKGASGHRCCGAHGRADEGKREPSRNQQDEADSTVIHVNPI